MKEPRNSIYQSDQDSLKDLNDPQTKQALPEENDLFYQEYRSNQRKTFFVVASFFIIILIAFALIFRQHTLKLRPTLSEENSLSRPELDYVAPSGFNFNSSSDSPVFAVEDLLEIQPIDIPEEAEIPFNSQWVKQAAYHLSRGETLFREQNYTQALKHYQKALKIYPKLFDIYKFVGLIHLRKKQYNQAIEAFEIASQHEPLNHGLLNNLGVAELAQENMEKAAEYFERSLTLTTGYPLAHYNLASLYYRMEKYDKAITFFQSYTKLDNNNMEASQMHANALIRLEKWAEAVELLESIVRRAADVAPLHFRLAQTLAMTGATEKALRSLERGINLVDAKKALAWMSRNEYDILRSEPKFQMLVQDLGNK